MQDQGHLAGWEVARPRAMYLLSQANHAVRSRLEAALSAKRITGIQYTVLSVIADRKGVSSAELARRFFVTPQTMNELIGVLQRRGLILRKEDPANRRILRMRLTAAGRRVLTACDEIADAVESEIFGFMNADDYLRLRELTRLVARNLRGSDEALWQATPAPAT
jgi:DNA-binding MarR family transcriptional regulator